MEHGRQVSPLRCDRGADAAGRGLPAARLHLLGRSGCQQEAVQDRLGHAQAQQADAGATHRGEGPHASPALLQGARVRRKAR